MVIPKVPSGVSGTALAASLLRDGWSVCPTSFLLFFSLFSPLFMLLVNIHCIISLLRSMRNTKKLLMLFFMRGGEGDMQKQFWKGLVIVLVTISKP
jgi:hypothetical protein